MKIRIPSIYAALWVFLLTAVVCHTGYSKLGLQILPRGRPFRLTFADPREIKMALSFEGDTHLNAAVGNYFSIFSFQEVGSSEWRMHFGLEGAGYFVMRQEGSRFPLETADGLVGLYLEGNRGPWQAQLRYTHVSAHLADGSSEIAIPYSRETLALRGAFAPSERMQAYAGASYLAHTIPLLPRFAFQLGGNVFFSWYVDKIAPFIGVDLKWKEEVVQNPSLSLQIGFALNNPPEAYKSFRFFYAYFTGGDPRGQFYLRPYTSHSLGLEMQI